MKRLVQSVLIGAYARLVRAGLLSSSGAQSVFVTCYEWYKLLVEAGDIRSLRRYVKPGEVVIVVGANIGFFTKRFARRVSGGGFVIAIEPEPVNFRHLQRNLDASGAAPVVRAVQGVAAEANGRLKLKLNPLHPGDHRLSSEGIDVEAFTVDALVQRERAQRVCVIKIDVQGAEERVLAGAMETIRRDRPTIFMEVDDDALHAMGSSAERLVKRLIDLGYVIRPLANDASETNIPPATALSGCREGRYADLLFVAPSRPPSA